MSDQLDPAAVFAIVNDPKYNALRLFLKTEDGTADRFSAGATDGERAVGSDDHADMVGGSERS